MIKGLFEAHLPVSDLEVSIEFYKKLGLEFAYRDEETAFFWIERGMSWLGLWEGKEVQTPYHPSLRHIAFRVEYEFMKQSLNWLKERNIEAVPFGVRGTNAPFIRPYQGNTSVYFTDPDGNSIEFMSSVSVPDHLKSHPSCTLDEWEVLLVDKVENKKAPSL
jgi:catechol 2,3-dioxygenase-like lactoylglutathione lyase family enzyme